MNIWALEGHKVLVTEESANNGYDYDIQDVKESLESGKIYEVEHTVVGSSGTRVTLKGVSGDFNSVNFEDAIEQSKEDNVKHSQWRWYN